MFFKPNPMRCKAYRDFVASLPCCGCGGLSDEAHHIIDAGLGGGMGTKESDSHTLPLCRRCHNLLHHDVGEWELHFGDQATFVLRTQIKAEAAGWRLTHD